MNPREHVDVAISAASSGAIELVDVAEFIELPQPVLPVGIPSFVRLKILNDGDSVTRHLPIVSFLIHS